MKLRAMELLVAPGGMPTQGERRYIEIDCAFSPAQLEDAICTLLGSLPEQDALLLLRNEFPQLFETTA